MKNFRSYDLAVAFYRQAKALRLPVHLKDQLMRAASSVALNQREGAGRPTRKDQARFFGLEVDPTHDLVKLADTLAAHVYRLHKVCES